MASPNKPQLLIFPFMAQSHTLPLLDLSKALSSRNIKVTIVTTPLNAKSILIHVSKHPNISITELPFPNDDISGLPKGCENTSELPSLDLHPKFLLATKHLQKPFEDLLRRMRESETLPICVISDFFLGFTLKVCQSFGVPRLVFHGMGVFSMAISKAVVTHKPHLGNNIDPIVFPGIKLPFPVTASDLSLDLVSLCSGAQNPMSHFWQEVGEAEFNSWGVVVNSFVEMEIEHISFLESFYNVGARAWCVGPLNLYGSDDVVDCKDHHQPSDEAIMKWLDDMGPESVLYVSFGSQSDVSDTQLDEVAYGLAESQENFILVVRSKTWTVPNDIKEMLNDKGLVVSDWVNQRGILSHGSVGGFLSHCGWNSVLESLSAGVPILAWPLFADQGLNAKLVTEGLRAGVRVRVRVDNAPEEGLTSRGAICEGVRELMGPGEKGRVAKERAKKLRHKAWRAVEEGGSSWKTLNELIEKIKE